jgi:ABC-2 type transport system permease protein
VKDVRLIAWREFLQYLRARGFLLTLLLVPLWIVVSALLHHLATAEEPTRVFAVVDDAGGFIPAIDRQLARERAAGDLRALATWAKANADMEALARASPAAVSLLQRDPDDAGALADFLAAGGTDALEPLVAAHLRPGASAFRRPRFHLRRIDVPAVIAAAARAHESATLLPVLHGEQPIAAPGGAAALFALVVLPAGFSLDRPGLDYWSENQTDPAVRSFLQRALIAELRSRTAQSAGLDPAIAKRLLEGSLDIRGFDPINRAAQGAVGDADVLRILFPYVVALLLLLSILSIASMLLIAVIEEKSSRIVEMILASVSPNRLMLGKLLGAAGAAMVMIAGWLLGGGGVASLFSAMSPASVLEILANARVFDDLPLILLCFACGLVTYTMIFLGLGAMARSFHEAQSFLGPLMFLLFAPIGFLVIVHNEPNGWLATLLSFSPFHAAFFLMIRLPRNPPPLATAIAFLWMLISTAGVAWVMARGFARNILRTEASEPLWSMLLARLRPRPRRAPSPPGIAQS